MTLTKQINRNVILISLIVLISLLSIIGIVYLQQTCEANNASSWQAVSLLLSNDSTQQQQGASKLADLYDDAETPKQIMATVNKAKRISHIKPIGITLTEFIASQIASSLIFAEVESAREMLQSLSLWEEIAYFIVYDHQQQAFVSYFNQEMDKERLEKLNKENLADLTENTRLLQQDNFLMITRNIDFNDKKIGFIVMGIQL